MHTHCVNEVRSDPQAGQVPRAPSVRRRGLAVAAIGAGLLLAALAGVHKAFDTPTCGALANTGYPCPGCGVTTSIDATMRGDLLAALRANLFGVVLVAALAVLAAGGLVEAVTGRDVLVGKLRVGRWWLVGAVLLMLLGWGVKLGAGLQSGYYPLR